MPGPAGLITADGAAPRPPDLIVLDADDAGELLTLQRAAFVEEAARYLDFGVPAFTQTLAELQTELRDEAVLALGLRGPTGRLLASVRARRLDADAPVTAHIEKLVTAPDQQGRGLGTRLLRALEQRLPADVGELMLNTATGSEHNLRLYRRLGYVESGRRTVPAGYELTVLRKSR